MEARTELDAEIERVTLLRDYFVRNGNRSRAAAAGNALGAAERARRGDIVTVLQAVEDLKVWQL